MVFATFSWPTHTLPNWAGVVAGWAASQPGQAMGSPKHSKIRYIHSRYIAGQVSWLVGAQTEDLYMHTLIPESPAGVGSRLVNLRGVGVDPRGPTHRLKPARRIVFRKIGRAHV